MRQTSLAIWLWINLLIDALVLGMQDGTIRKDLAPVETAIFLSAAAEAALDMTPDYQILLIRRKIKKESYLQHSIDLMLQGIANKKILND
jgi:TetR/AcrR family transcriptional regulator